MKVSQAVFGAFHHFDLGRELERRGHLKTIYSTWPWARLKREGLPHSKVETFPWVHTPETVLGRFGVLPRPVVDQMGVWNALSFDEWTLRKMRKPAAECDALIALAGAALKTGKMVQERGGVFICDRGSTHQRYQERIVTEEFRRWDVDTPTSDERDTVREEAIYEMADAITVGSTSSIRSYVEMGVPAEKVHAINYGVRLENFRPTGEAPKDEFCVLYAGGVGLRKGVPYLLEAFARVRHPKKKLRMVGAMQPEMRDVIGRLPMEQVELVGSLPRQELATVMSRSHVLVLPSIEDGFGMVMGEAMACGCPVIGSENTGVADLITDGVEGFVVPIRDPETLAERLQRLADEPGLQEQMRVAGLERVRSLGGWEDYGDKWESLLKRLTGKS